MRWAGHVARVGEERGYIGSCWGNPSEGEHWGRRVLSFTISEFYEAIQGDP